MENVLLPTVNGYAAKAAGERLEPFSYEPPQLGESEVRVKVSHCGVCYSDVQAIDDFYGVTPYPFVPGHEVVGYVAELGSAVTGLRQGDRIAIGWQGRSCGTCEWCLKGEEQLCVEVEKNGVWFTHGGFASTMVADRRFVYPVPEAMPSEQAAVLMCAGATVYSSLRTHAAGPSSKVGVIGVGGLGHLAIQFASTLGCRVTAFSSTPEKRAEALAFGAHEFIHVDDLPSLKQRGDSYDLVLYTNHAKVDWRQLVDLLKRRGTLVMMGFPRSVDFDPQELVVRELSIKGSFLCSPALVREMLAFAQAKGVRAKVELMPMSRANEAIQKTRENRARYRVVLTNG